MIILNTTTKSLEAKLAGAVATSQLPIVVGYVELSILGYTPAENDTATNNTTAVTIVPAPGSSVQSHIKSISVWNKDTAVATVTIQYNNNGTLREIVKIGLAVGDTLQYNDGEGWRVIDASGNIKSSGSGGSSLSLSASQIAGRGSASGTGVPEAITLGTGLSMSGTTLSASGGLVAISEQTASASATIDFTGLSSSYKFYVVSFRDVVPSTGDTDLRMLMSTNGGSSWLSTGYFFVGNYINESSANTVIVGGGAAYILIAYKIRASSNGNANGEVTLYNMPGSLEKIVGVRGGNFSDNGTHVGLHLHGGNTGITAVNAIRFYQTSGNIASGKFTLLGVPA